MILKILTRKKILNAETVTESRLARVLSTFDLTALGIGSTLGVGVYVLAGKVAKDVAGPAVILSFFIAAVTSLFAGLCYAEFGARVPKAGSAYVYSYVCIGEFVAFVIGWNLILEYIIGAASVARGFTLYLDTLLNDTLKNTFIEIAPINVPYMSSYFDFFSFGCVLLLTVGLAFGMKESAIANNIFTIINIIVVVFVVIAGSIKADINNWKLPAPTNVTNGGNGGFFPFGFSGILKGAATCFYGFVGFDCIATTGEEVRNPQKSIPFAILLSLFIVFLSYFGTSAVITLMVPYYLEDVNAPIPKAFDGMGMEVAKWIVTVGGMFGLCASLFGAMFPLPRIIYAMASDGLIFKFLGRVNQRFSTPVIGTFAAGILTGLMGALFELDQLVNMMSIGTLMAYTIVAACVLILRYGNSEDVVYHLRATSVLSSSDDEDIEYTVNTSYSNRVEGINADQNLDYVEISESNNSIMKQIFNLNRYQTPTSASQSIVTYEVLILCILGLLIGLCAKHLPTPISDGEIWAILLISLIVICTLITLISVSLQPQCQDNIPFKVPLTPLVPVLSILVNIYLMLMLDVMTWIRFAIWLAVGLPIYIFKLYQKAQNSKIGQCIKSNNTNGHINNGNVNLESVPNNVKIDENVTIPKLERSTTLTEEAVIENLDEILSKEEENLNSYFNDNKDRKFSNDTVSIHSAVYYEENVVAMVHREDNRISILSSHTEIAYTIPEESFESLNEDIADESTDLEEVNVAAENLDVATLTRQYNEAKNHNFSDGTSSEIIAIPMPPSIENFELYKTSTMPIIKIKRVSRLQIPISLKEIKNDNDNANDTSDEHVVKFGDKSFDNFRKKLEKTFLKRNTLPSSYIVQEYEISLTNDEDMPDEITDDAKDTNSDIKNKLEDLFKKRIDKNLVRSVSESALQIKTKEIESTKEPAEYVHDQNIVPDDNVDDKEESSSDSDAEINLESVKKKLENIFRKKGDMVKNEKVDAKQTTTLREISDVNVDDVKTETIDVNATIGNNKTKESNEPERKILNEAEKFTEVYGVKLRKVGRI